MTTNYTIEIDYSGRASQLLLKLSCFRICAFSRVLSGAFEIRPRIEDF